VSFSQIFGDEAVDLVMGKRLKVLKGFVGQFFCPMDSYQCVTVVVEDGRVFHLQIFLTFTKAR